MIFDVTVADSDSEAASGVTGLYVADVVSHVDHLLERYAELLGRKQNSFRVRFGPLHITGCHKSACGGVNGIADIKGSANRRNLFVTTPKIRQPHQ